MRKVIAVIFGGNSDEYEVSLQSAYSVLKSIDRNRYEVCAIGITRKGQWFRYSGSFENIPADNWHKENCNPVIFSQNPESRGFIELRGNKLVRTRVDAAFPVLHGKNGEDGTVQGLLELGGIPVIGCKTMASALCMDKARAHILAESAGVRVPRALVIENLSEHERVKAFADEIGFPVFVKPLCSGSSFGITKVNAAEGLKEAIEEAFKFDDKVIIEEGIDGFEVGCAVMGDRELTIGEVDEIELADGFFDYTEKYTLKTSKIHVPARLPKEMRERIKATAVNIYKALGCSGFARVDMFITCNGDSEGDIVFNEVNTIPGFTSHSRFPGMMKEIGIEFPELVNRLIEGGLKGEKT